jgi:hypothetical protein
VAAADVRNRGGPPEVAGVDDGRDDCARLADHGLIEEARFLGMAYEILDLYQRAMRD